LIYLQKKLSENPDLAVAKSDLPGSGTIAAIEALGGIGKFVKTGDIVVISQI